MPRRGTRALLLPVLALLASCNESPTQPPDSAACATPVGTLTMGVGSENEVGVLNANSCLLGRGTYADRWEFVLTEPAIVEIIVSSTDFDAYLILRDADDDHITSDDDNAGNGNARLQFGFEAGTYYIFPTTYLDGVYGNYELTINVTGTIP